MVSKASTGEHLQIINLQPAPSELILGGQRSGKSARAEALAVAWLAQSPEHQVVFIATALAGDDEMRQRIARHRADRALRLSRATTVEEPLALADAIYQHSAPHTLLVVDCLTLWLTNLLMPIDLESNTPAAPEEHAQAAMLLGAFEQLAGPLVLVSNEIGLGVIPMGPEVRAFVDALGRLNQQLAQRCQRVTLMVAGLPVVAKDLA